MTPEFASVRAIVFDLDDTLCAYWDAAKAGLRKAFDAHLEHGKSVEEMLDLWGSAYRKFGPTIKTSEWYNDYLLRGEPTRVEQMVRTLALAGVKDRVLAQRLSDAYARERDRALRLFPESLEVLSTVHGRYPLGLLTNGPADIQRQEIATLGIESLFKGIFIEGEMLKGKPRQSVFKHVAATLGFGPTELVMVGNSYDHDIRPAVRAGWRSVWIRRPSDVPPSADPACAVPEERPENGPVPTAEIGDLRELLALLEA